jgi:hypothetical protein
MQSEQVNDLYAALAKAQAKIENAKLNKVNPHFRSKYADLAAIIDATRKPLAEQGLSIIQTSEVREGSMVLITTLAHSSGQWIRSEYPLPVGKPQEMGSARTYARRYEWSSITGIAADEDDDANAAQASGQKIEPTKVAPRKVEAPISPDGEVSPHAIAYDGNAIDWGARYVAALKASYLPTDLAEWSSANQATLRQIKDEAPKVFARIEAAAKGRLNELTQTLEAAE